MCFSRVAVRLPAFGTAIFNVVEQLFQFHSTHFGRKRTLTRLKSTARRAVWCNALLWIKKHHSGFTRYLLSDGDGNLTLPLLKVIWWAQSCCRVIDRNIEKKKKEKEIRIVGNMQLKMFSQDMREQQSHSHGSVPGTAKVRRTAGNPFSLQQTPDVHISPALSPCLFLVHCLCRSPQWKGEKNNWQRCAPVVKLAIFFILLPTAFLRFPTLHPRCGQSGRNSLDEPLELKMEI